MKYRFCLHSTDKNLSPKIVADFNNGLFPKELKLSQTQYEYQLWIELVGEYDDDDLDRCKKLNAFHLTAGDLIEVIAKIERSDDEIANAALGETSDDYDSCPEFLGFHYWNILYSTDMFRFA